MLSMSGKSLLPLYILKEKRYATDEKIFLLSNMMF